DSAGSGDPAGFGFRFGFPAAAIQRRQPVSGAQKPGVRDERGAAPGKWRRFGYAAGRRAAAVLYADAEYVSREYGAGVFEWPRDRDGGVELRQDRGVR